MTIREMRVFYTVAECGKMVDASAQLYIAPASVSQTIANIEAEFGVKLFERLSKKLYITDAGSKLLVYVKHLLNLYDEMEKAIKAGDDSLAVRIYSVSSVAAYRLPYTLQTCQKKCPGTDFQVTEGKPKEIEEALLQNSADAGIMVGKVHNKDLISIPVWKDRVVFICGDGSPFCGRKRVSPAELQDVPFILSERGRIARDLLDEVLKKHDIAVRRHWECRNFDSIVNAVRMNYGVSVISKMWLETDFKDAKLNSFELEGEDLSYDVSLVYHKDKHIFPALNCFLSAFQGKC